MVDSKNTISPRVAILGAGFSGLTTAYYLKKLWPAVEVILLEKNNRVGGMLDTVLDHGQLFERGPRGIRPQGRKGQILLELIFELGLQKELIGSAPGATHRYFWKDRSLHVFPTTLSRLLTSPLTRNAWWRVLAKDLSLLKSSRPQHEESVRSFCVRHFGPAITDEFIDPLLTGIWAGDLDHLSIQATLPLWVELEKKHGSLLLGAIRERKRFKSRTRRHRLPPHLTHSSILTFSKGISRLAERLAEEWTPSQLWLSSEVTRILPLSQSRGFEINVVKGSESKTLHAHTLISTLPAYALAKAVRSFYSDLSTSLESIPYAPLALVPLLFDRPVNPYTGLGYLVPPTEQEGLLGAYWNDQTFPKLYPEKLSHMTVLLGGRRDRSFFEKSDTDFMAQAITHIQQHLQIKALPRHSACHRWPQALPQYEIGHLELIRQIQELLPPRFLLGGNYLKGVGMADLVVQAKKLAQKAYEQAKGDDPVQKIETYKVGLTSQPHSEFIQHEVNQNPR